MDTRINATALLAYTMRVTGTITGNKYLILFDMFDMNFFRRFFKFAIPNAASSSWLDLLLCSLYQRIRIGLQSSARQGVKSCPI